ncbi:MAG: hypothetical protein U0353_27485 [Sandaracinus sp.]
MNVRPYRWPVLAACSWRLIAELYRRHAHRGTLRIIHFHPGLSAWGVLRLQEGWERPDAPRIDVSLGGGDDGLLVVEPWRPVEAPPIARWPDRNLVRALLAAPDPKTVIDDVEASAGLGPIEQLPPSTPSVVAVRAIAEVLARHALGRRSLRASCGFHDASPDPFITSWARTAPTIEIPSAGPYTAATTERANRIWALHPSLEHEGPAGDELPRGSVVIDIVTGEVWRATGSGRRESLRETYAKAHRIDAVADHLESLMQP